MKRIVTFSVEPDGRKKVQSISVPVNENSIERLSESTGFIDAGFVYPESVEGKKVSLYYNSDTQLIEVEYSDIQFEDLDPMEQIKVLKAENEALIAKNVQLEADNLTTQDAVMEMYELMLGGEI